MSRTTLASFAAALLLAAAGCSTPPRVATLWAERARRVKSAALGTGDVMSPRAEFGPAGDRDDDDLADLDGEEDLGDVVVELKQGIYVLDAAVLLRNPTSLVIRGEGSHKTRLELDTETVGSILVSGAPRVELRGLTVVGYTSGGLAFKDCPDVRVEDVHFAGASFGLELNASTAEVGTSVFAGCKQGVSLNDSRLTVRESAFVDCWQGLAGEGRGVTVTSCAFVDNHDAVDLRLGRDDALSSLLFVGQTQQTAWKGKPGVLQALLMPDGDLARLDDRGPHREVVMRDEFPDALREGVPPGFDLAGVHLALLRAEARGKKDPVQTVRDEALDRADLHAEAARTAARHGDLARARIAALQAVRYCGPGPLGADVPESVREVAELVTP